MGVAQCGRDSVWAWHHVALYLSVIKTSLTDSAGSTRTSIPHWSKSPPCIGSPKEHLRSQRLANRNNDNIALWSLLEDLLSNICNAIHIVTNSVMT